MQVTTEIPLPAVWKQGPTYHSGALKREGGKLSKIR